MEQEQDTTLRFIVVTSGSKGFGNKEHECSSDKYNEEEFMRAIQSKHKDVEKQNENNIPTYNIAITSDLFENVLEFYAYYRNREFSAIDKPLRSNQLRDHVWDAYALEYANNHFRTLERTYEFLSFACAYSLNALKELAACSIATRIYDKNPDDICKEFGVSLPVFVSSSGEDTDVVFSWADEFDPN
eukprot:TRINITY_DN9758_c0_g1_i13.p1 TRINITY_DN9758_c0_g1~~TRINITY_DN9758_c0_g1_i13.p1  ORF type:complete len:187 (-),score=17.60 TRINITY_DN9758_c0_g1_i13:160-720(-)